MATKADLLKSFCELQDRERSIIVAFHKLVDETPALQEKLRNSNSTFLGALGTSVALMDKDVPVEVQDQIVQLEKALFDVRAYVPLDDQISQIQALKGGDTVGLKAVLTHFAGYNHQQEIEAVQANLRHAKNHNLDAATTSFIATLAKPRKSGGGGSNDKPVLSVGTFNVVLGENEFLLEYTSAKDWRLKTQGGKGITSFSKCLIDVNSWTMVGRLIRVASSAYEGKTSQSGDKMVKIKHLGFGSPDLAFINAGGTAVFSANVVVKNDKSETVKAETVKAEVGVK